MGLLSEREIKPALPEGVEEIPATPEIPPHIEKGVTAVPTNFTAIVQHDKGNN